VRIVDETGDPKRGSRSVLAAQQYLGKLGQVAHGVVAVTSHGADGSRQRPLGVTPDRPASRRPKGRADPACHTKPARAWQLIAEARAAGSAFGLVVADSVDGERAQLEARRSAAGLPDVMGWRPAHGTWQELQDAAHPPHPPHPPAFTPAEAAQRLPPAAWQRTLHADSHGKALIRSVAERELGPRYGPDTGVRLGAATRDPATLDPATLKPASTWYLATSRSPREARPAQVYAR
jgi:DDE superfamily endonuclease